MVARKAILDRVAQLGERFKAERFRERVVERHLAGCLDRLGGDDEFGVLTSKMLDLIMLRKRHLERAGLAGGDTDKLIFEPGDKGVRADQHGRVIAAAAFKWLAVDRAGIGNDDAVVLGGLFAFALRSIRLVLLDDARDGLFDFGIGYIADKLGELNGLEIGSIGGTISTAIV